MADERWQFNQSTGQINWNPKSGSPSQMFLSVASDNSLTSATSMNPSYPFGFSSVNLVGLNGYCMDVWGGNLVAGAVVGTYPCASTGTTAEKQWALGTDWTLRPGGSNLCVGTQTQTSGPPLLVLKTCPSSPTADTRWFLTNGGRLLNFDGLHFVDMDASTFQGHSVTCNGNEEQRWHAH